MRVSLLIGAAVAVVGAAPGAQAQETTQPPTSQAAATQTAQVSDDASATTGTQQTTSLNEIVITGSRIRRANFDTIQPAEVLGSDQITKRGFTNLGTALQELPAFSTPGNSPVGTQGSFGAGQTFVNMYNLGSQRTLTLVNGRRFVSSASSSIFGAVAGSPVDLSAIPTALVDRTEVVAVGGAPTYGSDAIAGTVNVILKKDFQGVDVNVQSGLSDYGDAADYNASAVIGQNFNNGRGNVTVAVQYDKQNGLTTEDRKGTIGGADNFFGSATKGHTYTQQLYTGGQHYNVFTNTGMPMVDDGIPISRGVASSAITNSAGQALFFGTNGQLTPFVNGQLTGNSIYQAGGSGFPIADFGNLQVESNRVQVAALGHYDLTDHVKLNTELWYGHLRAANLRDQPYYNTALFGNAGDPNGNLTLSTDNPYLSTADRQTIINNLTAAGADPSTFYMARANTDLATGAFRTTTNLYRVVTGLEGDFSAINRTFNWEVTGTYGKSETSNEDRQLVTQNFFNALNAVRDSSGNIVCAPGYTNAAIATLSSTCAPLNVFGINQASKAATDYITAIARPKQDNAQYDVLADITGSIVTLPAGDAKFSLGYEYRRETTAFDPGAFYYGQPNGDGTRTQFGNSIPIDPVAGEYHTNEGFGEVNIPVVAPDMKVPLVYNLELQGAARFVDNNLTGTFWSYTGGGTYQPIRDITLRGNYTRSFRAPAITEAYSPKGQIFDTASDPCDSRYITGGPNPSQRAANCAAAGITQPFTSNIVDFTVPGTSSGNPHLQNEIADSWTAGTVLRPSFAPGLTVSADYISIDITNEIAQLGATDLLDACYDGAPGNSFCGTFTRDSSGQVTSVSEGYYNAAIESFKALQAELDYAFNLNQVGLPDNAGAIDLSVNYLHTFSHYYKVGTGDKQYTAGSVQEPKNNFTANINYQNGGFDFLWQTQYYSETRISINTPLANYQYPTMDAYVMYNASAGYEFEGGYRVRFIVDNVLNSHVPFPSAGYAGTALDRYYGAVLGRYFRLSAGYKF
ncbi:TonB-dependent receptor domain-containing protein [Nitrospirillum iridis]|uniref:Outer membrane receptor protein involved in Fe transport n=1 Tax=Nitrospirillum iridis TaxID=765888 RepID=A0A7X0EED0_9PROT|nr:TonB-dependent receptor [Nitrospirillum iridis]MBB6253767.1 outer membrane receptor protein involved in Fe transport [Nitrospirillum iridis]